MEAPHEVAAVGHPPSTHIAPTPFRDNIKKNESSSYTEQTALALHIPLILCRGPLLYISFRRLLTASSIRPYSSGT